MEEQPRQPILRYIFIGLSFVLIFVLAAYLAFRFSNRGEVAVTPTPSPTVSAPSVPPTGEVNSRIVLPAPKLPPLTESRRFPREQPLVTQIPTPNGTNQVLIAQDGKGNLLFNNLTHEENYQLKLAEIQAVNRLALARETRGSESDKQHLILEAQRDNNQAQLALAQARLNAETAERARTTETQRMRQDRLVELEQLRLANQITLAKEQAKSQPKPIDQIRLAEVQAVAQTNLEEQRIRGQIAIAESQANNQIRLARTQRINSQQQTRAQTATDLARLNQTEKIQLANQAFAEATREKDQRFALEATRLRTDLALLAEAQHHAKNKELLVLQSRIQERLLSLQERLRFSRIGNFSSYDPCYSPYVCQ